MLIAVLFIGLVGRIKSGEHRFIQIPKKLVIIAMLQLLAIIKEE
jgi:hypothetical protein